MIFWGFPGKWLADWCIEGWPRKVTWNEFKGAAPQVKSRKTKIGVQAAYVDARSKLSYKTTAPARNGLVRVKSVRVKVWLNSSTSWSDGTMQTSALLKHEQGHYDFVGLAARDLARAFLNLGHVRKSAVKAFAARQQRTLAALVKKNDTLYDKGTKHGSDAKEQKNWTLDIQDAIKKGWSLKDI